MKRFQKAVATVRDVTVAIGAVMCIILVHELGHYSAAVLSGVSVASFNVAMGPTLIRGYVGNTQVNVRAIPLGGYVSFVADAEQAASLAEMAGTGSTRAAYYLNPSGWFRNARVETRVLIFLAGVVTNFISVIAMVPLLRFWADKGEIRQSVASLMGRISPKAPWIGPFGIGKLLIGAFHLGLPTFLLVTVYLSLQVAAFNLLPVFGFDGYLVLVELLKAGRSNPGSVPILVVFIGGTGLIFRRAAQLLLHLERALHEKETAPTE